MTRCAWCGKELKSGRLFSWLGELFCKQSCIDNKAVCIARKETETILASDISLGDD